MAENEILDLGHAQRWRRTRKALSDPQCTQAEVVGAACDDLEDVCRRLPAALRKQPLAILLGPALDSASQAQAVVASFTEKHLACVVRDSIKLARSNEPAEVAASASKRILVVLVDQFRLRVGKTESYRSCEERSRLVADVARSFGAYEDALRLTIESSLRGAPIRRFKSSRPSRPRMTAQQIAGLSVMKLRPDAPHAS